MTNAEWLPHDVIRAAGLALLHSLWQGAALAALAAAAMALARRASARYLVAVSALALALAAPAATFALVYARGGAALGPPFASLDARGAPLAAIFGRAHGAGASFALSPGRGSSADDLAGLVALWLAGVVVFGGRAAGGVALLARLRRRPGAALDPALERLGEEVRRALGLGRVVRYARCDWLDAPAAVGWLRPVVYLPLAALSGLSESQLRAVIAHELAHVKRLDALVNGFQIAAEALLFYHPAAWWLSRRIREEREHCCDDVAAAACGDPADYARALLSLEEARAALPFAMAANGGSLRARVARLLAGGDEGPGLRASAAVAAAASLAAALAVGACLLGLEFGASWSVKVSAARPAGAPPAAGPEAGDGGEGAPGLDQLVAFRIHGVTPAFVRSVREAGYSPDADQLVAMRVHGVTPEDIAELGELGYRRLDVDDLVAFRVHGVTPAFIAAVQKLGYARPSPDELVSLRIHGVTPEDIAELRALGVPGEGERGAGRARARRHARHD
ncbi:MAG TPA: M56 family metallopeptidase [Polyangiaceae bacterium]|nr:M56 family metallopeptidase [Polyangiaceae bacterium]